MKIISLLFSIAVLASQAVAQISLADPWLIASLTAPTSAASTNLNDCLVAYWPLNEESSFRVDAHGGNDLSEQNNPPSGSDPFNNPDNALSLEADDGQYLYLADNGDLSLADGDTPFFISLWFTGESNGKRALVSKGVPIAGQGAYYVEQVNSTTITFHVVNAGGVGSVSTNIQLGVWAHFVYYHDAANNIIGIYKDGGVVPVTAAYSGGTVNDTNRFSLGKDFESYASSTLDGTLYGVGLWKDCTVTSNLVAQLYNGSNNVVCCPFYEGPFIIPREWYTNLVSWDGGDPNYIFSVTDELSGFGYYAVNGSLNFHITTNSEAGWTVGTYVTSTFTEDVDFGGSYGVRDTARLTTTPNTGGGSGGVGWWAHEWGTNKIVFDGNSLTTGDGAGAFADYPWKMIKWLTTDWTWWTNKAVGGQDTLDMLGRFNAHVLPCYDATKGNTVVAWEIYNDLYGGATASTAYTNFTNYCWTAKQAGFRVLAIDVLAADYAGQPGDFETSRLAISNRFAAEFPIGTTNALTWLPTNGATTWADAYLRLSGEARLVDPTDTTFTQADKLHRTSAGYSVIATNVYHALRTINVLP